MLIAFAENLGRLLSHMPVANSIAKVPDHVSVFVFPILVTLGLQKATTFA